MIGRVMEGARAWIEEIGRLDSIGLKSAPDLQFMAHAILERVPALKPRYALTLTSYMKLRKKRDVYNLACLLVTICGGRKWGTS